MQLVRFCLVVLAFDDFVEFIQTAYVSLHVDDQDIAHRLLSIHVLITQEAILSVLWTQLDAVNVVLYSLRTLSLGAVAAHHKMSFPVFLHKPSELGHLFVAGLETQAAEIGQLILAEHFAANTSLYNSLLRDDTPCKQLVHIQSLLCKAGNNQMEKRNDE